MVPIAAKGRGHFTNFTTFGFGELQMRDRVGTIVKL